MVDGASFEEAYEEYATELASATISAADYVVSNDVDV